MIRRKRASTRRRAAGGSRGFGRCGSLGGLLGLRFALLARGRAGWIGAFFPPPHAGLVAETPDPGGRQPALGAPSPDPLRAEPDAPRLALGQHRIEIAEAPGEPAVAGRRAARDPDVIPRRLLGSGAGEADFQGHLRVPFWSRHFIVGARLTCSLLLPQPRHPAEPWGLA